MFLTYRYDLRPSRAQHARLEQILEMQRLLYNAALQVRIDSWRYGKELAAKRGSNKPDPELDKPWQHITYNSQCRDLTQIRKDDPEGYGVIPANLCRSTLKRVDLAFKGFFSRLKSGNGKAGFPRFKPMSCWDSFGFTEFAGVRLIANKLHFKGLAGGLKLHMHRPLPDNASIRSAIFSKGVKGWAVFLQVETVDAVSDEIDPRPTIGLDVGVHHFAALSDGSTIANPRIGKAAAKRIHVARRALSRCKRGSNRRKKVKQKLLREMRHVANRRHTFLHQQSAALTRRYGLIAVEDLSLRNMTRSARGTAEEPGRNVKAKSGLNREILDVGIAKFTSMLVYKAERAGGRVIKVPPRGTSQMCSGCGETVKKSLSVRTHRCSCGVVMDRDVNAARNILARAVVGPGDAKPALAGSSRKAQGSDMQQTAVCSN